MERSGENFDKWQLFKIPAQNHWHLERRAPLEPPDSPRFFEEASGAGFAWQRSSAEPSRIGPQPLLDNACGTRCK